MVIGGKKAVLWSGIEKVSVYIINFIIQVVLARLLCPEDYAVVAMLGIFFAISQAFIDSGFVSALIQKKECTEQDYTTVFFSNLGISLFIYILLFVGAPYIESFYHFEGLTTVTRIYSLNLVIYSLSLVNKTILTKQLCFKQIAVVSFCSNIFSAIPAIFFAYCGWGYWALIFQHILASIITTALLVFYSRWMPKLQFSMKSLKSLAPFGLRVLVVYLFHAVFNNIYTILIGKRFTSVELGYYDRGKTLSSTGPVGLSDFFTRALYPIQAQMQDDSDRLKSSYDRSFIMMSYVVVPLSAFMMFFSDSVIFTLYGEKWLDSSWILAILTFGFLFYPIQALNVNMLKVKGRADLLLKSEVIKKTMGIVCVAILINYSLKAVVIGWTVCAIVEFIISEGFMQYLCNFSPAEILKKVVPCVVTSFLLSFALSWVVEFFSTNLYLQFFLGCSLFVLLYLIIFGKNIYIMVKNGN